MRFPHALNTTPRLDSLRSEKPLSPPLAGCSFYRKIPVCFGLSFKAYFFNGEAIENRLNFRISPAALQIFPPKPHPPRSGKSSFSALRESKARLQDNAYRIEIITNSYFYNDNSFLVEYILYPYKWENFQKSY